MSDTPETTASTVKPAAAGVEIDLVTYVCPRCGKKFEREEQVTVDPKENVKLYGTIAFGIVFLLGVWIWVFNWGVPLVRSLTKD